MKVKIKKFKDSVKLPSYALAGDAGLDLFSLEELELKPGERHNFKLGFALEIPLGNVGIIKDKSGLSHNYGLHTIGGVFDPNYRGEYNVEMVNLGSEAYRIKAGDKLAQLVIYPYEVADLEEVGELSESARGEGQFGSTGR